MEIVHNGETYVAVMNQEEIENLRRILSAELDRRETDFWAINQANSTDSAIAERIRERYIRAERNYVAVSQAIRGAQ